ncbi:hypothetical protein Hanom_Chr12g01160291 [Helianthus anomalus]
MLDHVLKEVQSNNSFLISSSHVNFVLPLLLLPSTLGTHLTVAVVCLLLACPNHLNLLSLILSDILVTSKLKKKTPFLSCLS